MERLLAPRHYVLILAGLIVLNVFVFRVVLAPRVLRVDVFAARESSVILVRTPGGATVLVDAGPDASILRTLGTTLPDWDRRINALVLTDMGAKSAGGANAVLERYRVGLLLRSSVPGSRTLEAALAGAESAARLSPLEAQRGMRLSLPDGVSMDVLWPEVSQPNVPDGTVVLRLSYGTTSFLIDRGLSPRADAWLRMLPGSAADVTIRSSTLPGAFVSNGRTVTEPAR